MSATIAHDAFTGPLGAQLQERFIAAALPAQRLLGIDGDPASLAEPARLRALD